MHVCMYVCMYFKYQWLSFLAMFSIAMYVPHMYDCVVMPHVRRYWSIHTYVCMYVAVEIFSACTTYCTSVVQWAYKWPFHLLCYVSLPSLLVLGGVVYVLGYWACMSFQ